MSRARPRSWLVPSPEYPGAAEERIRARKAGEQVNREMMERFAPLTAENAGEAIKWQEQRIRELLAGAP